MTSATDTLPAMSTRQRLSIALLLGTGFMLANDFSILNIALPRLGAGVGISNTDLPWVISAYALPAAGFTLLFGRVADIVGRRRMFLLGVALLTVSSLVGGLADSPAVLLAARAMQGFATAIAAPAALSLLVTSIQNDQQRQRVLGLNGALLSAGFTVGALLGGTLVSLLSWRWAFLINVPVAVLILVASPFLLPAEPPRSRVKLDVPGAITVTAGLLAFIFGIVNKEWGVFAAGIVLLVVFVLIERRSPAPLASVSILSRPTVKWGNFGGMVIFTVESGLNYMMTLYLQDVLKFSPLVTGLTFGVPGLASVVAGVIAGRLIGRTGARNLLVAGMTVQVAFTAPLLALGADRAWVALLIPALFIGFFGHVTAIVSFMVTATSGLPDNEQGLATALASMAQQVAVTIGVPILAAIAATQAVLLSGIHLAVGFDVVVTVVAIGLIWVGLRARPVPAQAVDGLTEVAEASEAVTPEVVASERHRDGVTGDLAG